jgi:AcrR family transcriptional regulator
MQTKKDEIHNIILQAAREEFLKKGFKDASMRTIARNAKVGVSNIYNYFKNKDEIFRAELSELLGAMDKIMKRHNSPETIDYFVLHSEDYLRCQIGMFVKFIDHYKEDFKLLLFKSAGSSLENYSNECIDKQTETGKEYIRLVKKKFPEINADISTFFIHTMSSWFMSSIAELVMHNLSDKEIQKFIEEYMEYATAGWKKIMRIK